MSRKDASAAGRAVAPDGGGIWASPPTGSRVSDKRVPAAAPEGAEVWLTAPLTDETVGADPVEAPEAGHIAREAAIPVLESVEWIEIVDDLRRGVVEVEHVEPETRPVHPDHEVPEKPAGEIAAAVELVPAVPGDVSVAGVVVALDAVLTISLEPEWPGNVHVYEITIDVRDGTFTGGAGPSSNIPGETIRGAFSDGFIDLDFTAVYPTPAYHYAWFGSGPLRGFIGSDSRGSVLHTVSATVTEPRVCRRGRSKQRAGGTL